MKNIEQLELKLKSINDKIINNLIEAQRETAKVICDDVKTLAPKQTGKYAESIKVGDTEFNNNVITTEIYTDATVSAKGNGNSYNLGYLLETGTSPHLIEPVDASVLHFQINGEDIFAKRVNHPGTVAQPHFSRGLEMNKLIYRQKISEAIRRGFNG